MSQGIGLPHPYPVCHLYVYCEERSDGAISLPEEPPRERRDCRPALAMTKPTLMKPEDLTFEG